MNVLIIDDEASLLKLLQLSLKSETTKISTAENGAKGLEMFQSDLFDVVLCDIGLPDRDGLDLLQEFKNLRPEIPVIVITAHGSIQSALTAMKRGAYDYVQKPFEPEEIKIVIERALHQKNLEAENSRLKREVSTQYQFSNIIGTSVAIKNVFERIKRSADTKGTILILGESGTGKELIAKAIHFNSPRKDKPMVVVDCASIPSNLLESELFGHVKGAFTGADRPKKGLCEEADGGTLFLDEIGELPLDLQAKLLRLLQESTIRKVGDTKPISIDVRIVAATHRNLEEEVKQGRFRQDLFYRLNVVPIHAPALRERKEDIPLLAKHFLKKYAKNYLREIESIDTKVMSRFMEFSWPGNVRQLENLLEQMVIMSEGKVLLESNLPPPLNASVPVEPAPALPDSWDLKKTLAQIQAYTEESMIRRALKHTQNNKTKAAELLGLSRRALIYKAQEYNLKEVDEKDLDEAEDRL